MAFLTTHLYNYIMEAVVSSHHATELLLPETLYGLPFRAKFECSHREQINTRKQITMGDGDRIGNPGVRNSSLLFRQI